MSYKLPPWGHQITAIERARALNHYALFFEMGAGKTKTAIEILREKFNKAGRVMRTLIFCPPIVMNKWKDEWGLHSTINLDNVRVLNSSGKDRVSHFLSAVSGSTSGPRGDKIFITNYESLLMEDLYRHIKNWNPECIVFDESHELKSHTSLRSKAAFLLGQGSHHKYLLSGTPVLNNPMDLFQQYKVMDGGKTFGSNFFGFRNTYFVDKNASWRGQQGHFPKWVLKPGMEEVIQRKLAETGMCIKKEQCGDLPPLVRTQISVPMSLEQARIYKDLARDYIAFIGEESVSANMALIKALRLLQLTSGFVSLDAKGEEEDAVLKTLGKTPKQEALRNLITELAPHSKIILWAVWKENYEQIDAILKDLQIDYVAAHGGVPDRDKFAAMGRFNSESSIRVFLGHPRSAGIGIDLRAPYSIFYSRTFSLAQSLQAEARFHRLNSKEWGFEKMTRIDLTCENTIDSECVTRLHNKEQMANSILSEMIKKSLVSRL